jgi:hypothetical protein
MRSPWGRLLAQPLFYLGNQLVAVGFDSVFGAEVLQLDFQAVLQTV